MPQFEVLNQFVTTYEQRLRAARSRVKSGARWLDENFPGWESRIDLDTLELKNSFNCICGQVFEKEARQTGYLSCSGFSYAESNLFTEANSWVTSLVGIKPGNPDTEQNDNRISALYDRITRVSIALGFCGGSITKPRWQRQAIYVQFEELQNAWVELLQGRANA